ncbi:MAG: hypothetical protein JO256_05240 [Alphaproteobacteria bacterium]|nr:hypothetical protein [Alphaproteobacteria bacterium]
MTTKGYSQVQREREQKPPVGTPEHQIGKRPADADVKSATHQESEHNKHNHPERGG